MLPPSEPLGALTRLDPRRLYLFAVGPTRGEALAVRLPDVGWLLIDCCRVKAADGSEVLPQEALVARFPGPIAARCSPIPTTITSTGSPISSTGFAPSG